MDDYANVLHGLVTLLSHRWRETDAAFAVALADAAMALFYDVENGGFYFTAANQPDLIFNPKPSFDEALPPGNATLANALLHLGQVLWERDVFGRGDEHSALGASSHGTLPRQSLQFHQRPAIQCRAGPDGYFTRTGNRNAALAADALPRLPAMASHLLLALRSQRSSAELPSRLGQCSNAQPSQRLCL